MALMKKLADGMLYKGGIFGAGILGVLLWRRHFLPEYMGIICMGISSLGFCSAIWRILKGKDKMHESYDLECKEIVDALYQKIVSQVDDSRQKCEDGTKELEERLIVDGTSELENLSCTSESKAAAVVEAAVAEAAVPNKENIISDPGSFLKVCAIEISTDESKMKEPSDLPEDASELPIGEYYALDPDFAAIREVESLAKTVRRVKYNCKSVVSGRRESNECEGQIFQASQLFKDWDARRPEIEEELSAVVWRGKGIKLKKILKGYSPKTEKRKD